MGDKYGFLRVWSLVEEAVTVRPARTGEWQH
jgi:hypothetical protein